MWARRYRAFARPTASSTTLRLRHLDVLGKRSSEKIMLKQ
jgi:hypothetical protein